ncbi:rhomboid family intramembrane serine protease [Ancrocorticia populi]|uniref:Rhomboid family intramembrane serine protease n=1 Tax=Ancrocorticia populi TaxID=2175228 RepID=A0A2V1K728_9ACTO|nr:rhomboid family intramembrane serine protease [Ancrocorticia populi]PWF26903.1 rhomboid family intramembrane serine protease [Ancrocorticia populi]
MSDVSSSGFWAKSRRFLGIENVNAPVTLCLIGVCVAVAIAEFLNQRIGAALVYAPVLGEDQPYRILGSAFLHAGFWHLVFNMYALWLVGSALEPAIGRIRFLGIYLLSAVAGNIAVLLTADPSGQSWITATVGASGAVFGVFGALFILVRHFGSNATSLIIVIVANLLLGFVPGMNISWQSHVGGLLIGGILMRLMTMGRESLTPTRRRIRDAVVFLVVASALVGLFFWGYR